MEKPEFDDYFAMLDKASARTRSVLYVFIIVSVAVLLYGLNAFAYPSRQFNYDNLRLQVRCFYTPTDNKCGQVKKFLDTARLPPTLEETIEKSLWGHELQLFYDDSVAVRTFKFPLFGLETDRDLLWLIFPLIGMLGYYIVWLTLVRLVGMFRFLRDRNRTDAVRLRLIQHTLVITTPLGTEHGEITPFYQVIWRGLAILVFAIPIIVSLLTIADQTNAIAVYIRGVEGEVFMKDRTDASLATLAFEVLALLLQLGLLGKLIALGHRFGHDQNEADRLVVMLEGAE